MGVSFDRALTIIRENAKPKQAVWLPAAITSGLVTARDLFSDHPVPEHDTAARDGYAVNSHNLTEASFFKPIPLKITAAIYAETSNPAPLGSNEAARVLTGGPVPEGADCVIQDEDVTIKNERLMVGSSPKPGEFVNGAGAFLPADTLIAKAGTVLSAEAVAASVRSRVDEVEVFRKPECLALALGNELLDPEDVEHTRAGMPADNAVMMRDLLRQRGAGKASYHVVPDSLPEVVEHLKQAAPGIVVTTGGTGASERDLARRAAIEAGYTPLYDGVDAIPCGKSFLAKRDDTLLFGLPGPSVSAHGCFFALVIPALRAMQGLPPAKPVTAILEEPCSSKEQHVALVPCTHRLKNGRMLAAPSRRGLPSIQTLFESSAYMIIPPGVELQKGDLIEILPLSTSLSS